MVRRIRNRLQSEDFMNRNKSSPKAFTRKRFFCFQTSCVMVLQKTLKSIQLHIHSLAHLLERDAARSGEAVTAGACVDARTGKAQAQRFY